MVMDGGRCTALCLYPLSCAACYYSLSPVSRRTQHTQRPHNTRYLARNWAFVTGASGSSHNLGGLLIRCENAQRLVEWKGCPCGSVHERRRGMVGEWWWMADGRLCPDYELWMGWEDVWAGD